MNDLKQIIAASRQACLDTNHIREGRSYFDSHIYPVMMIGEVFMGLIPEEDRPIVRAALALHDGMEDHRLNWNDIVRITDSEQVAAIVYAVTNEKGHNRAERANATYYKGIREVKYAPFVKFIDRVHNVADSRCNDHPMYKKYQKEHPHFMKELECLEIKKYKLLILALNSLFV